MNLKILVILCLVAVLLLPDAEGWRRRRRRRRRPCTRHCSLSCYGYRCYIHNGGITCFRLCRRVCRTVCYGKREAPVEDVPGVEEIEDPAKPSSGRIRLIPEPLPNKFSQYDANKDGKISFKEFKKALPHVKDLTAIRKGFDVIDKIDVVDSHISCDEFLKSYLNVLNAEKC